MNDLALITLFVAIVIFLLMGGVLINLWREQSKLKQDVQALGKKLQGNIEDIAGLCSAAVSVDQRLMDNESRLNGMLENINQPQVETRYDELIEEDQSQGYEFAIKKIHNGANVDDLVKNCGLTHDEAVLLIRLHGR